MHTRHTETTEVNMMNFDPAISLKLEIMNLVKFVIILFSVKLTIGEKYKSWHLSNCILLKIVLSESQKSKKSIYAFLLKAVLERLSV